MAFGRPLPRVLTAMCLQQLAFFVAGVPACHRANEAAGGSSPGRVAMLPTARRLRPLSSTARIVVLVRKPSGSNQDGASPTTPFIIKSQVMLQLGRALESLYPEPLFGLGIVVPRALRGRAGRD